MLVRLAPGASIRGVKAAEHVSPVAIVVATESLSFHDILARLQEFPVGVMIWSPLPNVSLTGYMNFHDARQECPDIGEDHAALAKVWSALASRSNRRPNPEPSMLL
jgi:hypothetical protein